MPVSDPIGDMLTRMRNAQHARSESCTCPWSRHKEEICEVLKKEGFIKEVGVEGSGIDKIIVIQFDADRPVLELKRVSKPGRRLFSSAEELKPVLRGLGISILSTSKGVISNKEARKEGVGGEVLCTVS